MTPIPDLILFLALAVTAILTATAMLASRNTVYSALYLVLNFVTVAVIYLLLDAAFIAMVQVSVYAGAIMVLFLFVIMLLGGGRAAGGPSLRWQPGVALTLALALAIVFMYVLLGRGETAPPPAAVSGGFGSPVAVGSLLFDRYLVPFEVTSVLLLVAMVGAIVLTRGGRKDQG